MRNMIILKIFLWSHSDSLTGILYPGYKEKYNILVSSASVILPQEKLVLPTTAVLTKYFQISRSLGPAVINMNDTSQFLSVALRGDGWGHELLSFSLIYIISLRKLGKYHKYLKRKVWTEYWVCVGKHVHCSRCKNK